MIKIYFRGVVGQKTKIPKGVIKMVRLVKSKVKNIDLDGQVEMI